MNKQLSSIFCTVFFIVMIVFGYNQARAEGLWKENRETTHEEWFRIKKVYDDTYPIFLHEANPKNYLSPELYNKVTFDKEEMKKAWSDVIGLKASDQVGKISPEINPGTYSYTDKEKYDFKKLMPPVLYNKFAKGAPPHIGNSSEIKIIPTRQYYWALPISKATKQYEGTCKQDEKGYFIPESYVAGYPFPKPSGPFKAQQIIYNQYKRYTSGENRSNISLIRGFDKNLKQDYESENKGKLLRTTGRVLFEPYGNLDERAKNLGENHFEIINYITPQASSGNAIGIGYYDDPKEQNLTHLYFNQTRRIRKLSSEDTQDPFPGLDYAVDDSLGFEQKLRPDKFPYAYKVLEEREYLIPVATIDGSSTIGGEEGKELKNFEWERRPMYVLELTQQDSNYLYSKRHLYYDKETFLLLLSVMYDQKERLYRTIRIHYTFLPEQGIFLYNLIQANDHIDTHSCLYYNIDNPFDLKVGRDDLSVGSLLRKGR